MNQPVGPDGREMIRFLKALGRAPEGAALAPDGSAAVALEVGGIRRFLRFGPDVAERASSDGLAERRGSDLVLSEAGAAWLARATAPAEPFLAQHRPLAVTSVRNGAEVVDVLVDEAESPLAWLRRRKGPSGEPLISDAAFLAGERLRADYTRANLLPKMSAAWDQALGGSQRSGGAATDYSDIVIAARQRVQVALGQVGPDLSGVLVDVCCFLKGLADVERERGWPVRSGKVVLSIALGRLASHYGFEGGTAGPRRAATRSWRKDGSPPSLALRPPPGT